MLAPVKSPAALAGAPVPTTSPVTITVKSLLAVCAPQFATTVV